MQNQGLGRHRVKMYNESASKNTPQSIQTKHLGYAGKKALPGVRSPCMYSLKIHVPRTLRKKVVCFLLLTHSSAQWSKRKKLQLLGF